MAATHGSSLLRYTAAMFDTAERHRVLSQPKPDPPWQGEPMFGSLYGDEEIEAAVAAMRDSITPDKGFNSSAGSVADFETAFAAHVGTRHAIAINSAGSGLDMAMRYLELQPGDEVIVPAINFQAAALAVMGAGGQVVWSEVDARTFQMDPNDVEKRITPRTRAIFPVHMNGLSAPMDDLVEVAQQHPHELHGPLAVVGDAARACGGSYRGTKIGKKGLATIFSFHTMKNITTLGEGGMITTDDDKAAATFRSARFFGIQTDVWGSSNMMTNVQAAVGLVQLAKLDDLIERRRSLALHRHEMLDGLKPITRPFEPADCVHTYYLYTCLVPEDWAGTKRDELMAMMASQFAVGCTVANPPVYEARGLLRQHTAGQRLPHSEALGKRLFCVPIHPGMTPQQNQYIAAALIECVERMGA